MDNFIKIICPDNYDISIINPASRKRQWMDETPNRYAYRCLPLTIANEYGWEFSCPHSFDVYWNGGPQLADVIIKTDSPNPIVKSHFGSGIVTFSLEVTIVTDQNHNLMITGPINQWKSLIHPMSGVIESDWMPYIFTMNWKFSKENEWVSFEKGETFCRIFPVPKYIDNFDFKIDYHSNNKDLIAEQHRWSNIRSDFDQKEYKGKEFNANLPRMYYNGKYSDGSCPKTEHKTRLNLKCNNAAEKTFQGKTFSDILLKDECQFIIDFCKSIDNWESAGEYWQNRVLNLNNIKNKNIDVFILLVKTLEKINKVITTSYNLTEEIYPDILQIVRWPNGLNQPVHADRCNPDGTSNGLDWRHFGAILYLNDDFEGGETYYPNHGISISPEAGKLAVHLGDLNHNHGVTEVKGNTRYTLASFWGFDRSKKIILN